MDDLPVFFTLAIFGIDCDAGSRRFFTCGISIRYVLQGSIFIHVSVSGFSCAEKEQNKADSNLKYMFIMVASRAKVAPFALCLLGGSAPKPILPDLAICGWGVLLRPT